MPIRPMTDEEIHQAALSDPDNPPMTLEDWAKLKPSPRVRTIRRALGLTQEEFAAKFHIPVGTLRDWEQGRVEPDKTARAYLKVIAHEREAVERALNAQPLARSETPETEPQNA
jgi:putative transcriptional regulator